MATAIFVEQKRLGEEIDRAATNYGKAGRDRKNSVEFLKKKIDSIKSLYSEFYDNNKEIEDASTDAVQDHDYFVNNYFATITDLYTKVLLKMESDAKSFSDGLGLGENVVLSEMLANKEFAKRMLTLLSDRTKKCPNMDLKTWKFNLLRADRYWQEYSQCKQKIEAGTGASDDLENEASNLHDVHQTLVVMIEERIAAAEETEEREYDQFAHVDLNRTMLQINESLSRFSPRHSSRDPHDDVKLPRIQIPKFDGSFSKWAEFRDLFIALIHSKKNLPNVQKMQYLKSNLESEAADIIRHLQITDVNYETAWTLIERRFNNKKMLLTNYLSRFFNQPVIETEQPEALKKLLDGTKEILMSLRHLGEPTEHWGSIIVFVLTQRLSPETFRLWEESCGEETSNVEKLERFIETRFRTLENLEMRNKPVNTSAQSAPNKPAKAFTAVVDKCGLCTGNRGHKTFKCFTFKNATPEKRTELIKNASLCVVCFGKHDVSSCTSTWKCYTCQGRHNTSLHAASQAAACLNSTNEGPAVSNADQPAACLNCINESYADVLLATAVVKVKHFTLRALIDQGSTVSFISERAVQALNLERGKESLRVLGVAGTTNSNVRGSVTFSIQPHFPSEFKYTIKAYVLQTVAASAPPEPIKSDLLTKFQNLQLADPVFNAPNKIDILLGADVLAAIILKGIICGQPLAQETTLGWVISGKTGPPASVDTGVCLTASLDQQVEKFWKIEEIPDHPIWSAEEAAAENHYIRNHSVDENGRYVVQLPLKNGEPLLGRSRNIAVANLLQLEKKFRKNPLYKAKYTAAMNEYFDKCYAEPVMQPESQHLVRNGNNQSYSCFYMPHLAVMKESSASTKTRIVFDASRKSANGVSLNDMLMTGPTIQSDIVEKLLNFRKHRYAFTCDAEKMYLQIRVHHTHLPYQRFVWRENEDDAITDYCLNTVVFGQSSAPFLAIRTFQQIALDNKDQFPLGAWALENEFYVDDLLAGEDSVDKAVKKKDELIKILGAAGIKLRKWASNEEAIVNDILPVDRESGAQIAVDNDAKVVKTLGIYWDNNTDMFKYKIAPYCNGNQQITKRKILSESAKLFDPIGWVQPVIIVAKMLLQELWLNEVGWDDTLDQEIQEKWSKYRLNLREISKIELPRWIGISEPSNGQQFELHVFADASEKAYGAVAYLKDSTSHHVHIIMAKSRVAPLRKKSLARLELCAALLAVNLVKKVKKTLPMHNCSFYGWSDSTITLAWINKPPNTWKTFVCQRVSQIQEVLSKEHWNHVKSAENPADLISRGCDATLLRQSALWWHGPQWLASWTKSPTDNFETTEELHKSRSTLNCNSAVSHKGSLMENNSEMYSLILKISSFNRLIGTVAWTRRAVNSFKSPRSKPESNSRLTPLEREEAQTLIIKLVQEEAFGSEMEQLRNGALKSGSILKKVDAWMDGNGVLRVGGRLAHAELSFDQKHPQLLPYHHPLTRVIIRMVHKECFHAGNRATLATIRQKYWIIKGNSAVKLELQNCTICKRFRAQVCTQLMGQLPSARVTTHKPFTHTGCDLAGPIFIKSAKGRGIRTTKGYIVIFICMSTKAIHIELVGDLTSSSFIAALKRLISRRGSVSELYSDNGTNFVGANNVLIRENMKGDADLQNFVCEKKIQWHFLPPYSPHMGGLWEAGVKSIKHHLNRTLNGEKLTIEEMNTVLCQIEGCLNSRPLLPLSENMDDLEILTPGHFLIGRALTAPVERSYLESNPNHLTRWQQCSRLFQTFWNKWKTDYLNQIRQRSKWSQTKNSLSVDDVVVIKEDHTPPNQWKLGKVTDVHPGVDGLVRAVSLKTVKGTVKRNITKLIVLSPCQKTPPPIKGISSESDSDTPVIQSARKQRLDRRNKKKASISNAIIISLLMNLLFAAMIFGNTIKVDKLNHESPSIVFEEVDAIQYINNYWEILITHNRSHYNQELRLAKANANNLMRSFCQPSNKLAHECRIHSRNIQKKLKRITNNDEYLGNPNAISKATTLARGKREVLTTIGIITVGAALGASGKYVYDKFLSRSDDYDQIYQNQEILQTHLANETSILKDSFHIFKAQGETFDANFHEVYSIVNNATSEMDKMALKQKLLSLILDLFETLDDLIGYQERVMNPMIHFNEVIPADEMQIILTHINKSTQPDEVLPSFRGMYDIWHTAVITSRITDEEITFNVKIPLVNRCAYTLYQKHLLPVVRPNKKMIVIRDAYELYAIDCDKHTVSLSNEYVSRCIRLSSLICSNDIRYKESNACDNTWFGETGRSSESKCVVTETSSENVWISTRDGFLFSLLNDTSIKVRCANASWEVQLPRVGSLKSDHDCEISWANRTLKTRDEIRLDPTSFDSVPTKLKRVHHSKKLRPIELSEHKETLSSIENRLEKLKNEENKFTLHDVHHYSAPYLLAAVVLTVIWYIKNKNTMETTWYFTNKTRTEPAEINHENFIVRSQAMVTGSI